MQRERISNKTTLSWVLYDFANTIFSAIALTSYFPLYLTELAAKNVYLGMATTSAMILSGLAVPFLGALSDQTGKTKSYLIRTTLVTVSFFFAFSFTQDIKVLIFLFLVACFFYHSSLVFYNALLPVAAPPDRQGFASGLGTGLGYLGVVLVLPIAHFADQTLGRSSVFAISAFLFLLASLPLFFFVPERECKGRSQKYRVSSLFKQKQGPVLLGPSLLSEWQKVFETVKGFAGQPATLLFFGGNFFLCDALNSTIFWFLVYAREVFDPTQNQLILLLMATNFSAFLAGILAGFVTDRQGSLPTLLISGIFLTATLGLLSMAPSFAVFTTTVVTGGAFAIAGIWTAGRKAVVELAPKEKIGTYFGIYGLTTKLSVLGSFFFSVAADASGFRNALWLLVFPAAAGSLFLFFAMLLLKPKKK